MLYSWPKSRNGIYILDLQKTSKKLQEAYNETKKVVAEGGLVLFVGTKKQIQETIKTEAERCGMYYINSRWLGGTLTNFATIKTRIARLNELEEMQSNGTFEVLPKKEVSQLLKEKENEQSKEEDEEEYDPRDPRYKDPRWN